MHDDTVDKHEAHEGHEGHEDGKQFSRMGVPLSRCTAVTLHDDMVDKHGAHHRQKGKRNMRIKETPLTEAEEDLVSSAIGCGISVHRELGPGFREFIYEEAYCLELASRQIRYERQKRIAVRFKDWTIPGQKIDLIVEGTVLVEIKAVPRLRPIHRQQVLSYLKTTGLRVGLLLNFNVPLLKAGIRRVVL